MPKAISTINFNKVCSGTYWRREYSKNYDCIIKIKNSHILGHLPIRFKATENSSGWETLQ